MINMLKRLVGVIIGKIVLTAQLTPLHPTGLLQKLWAFIFYSKKEIKRLQSLYPDFEKMNEAKIQDKLELNRFKVNVKKGISLDTIEMTHPNHKESKKYVIYGWGRSDCYEKNLNRLATDALNLNAHIISFNFRGVGHSTGQPFKEHDLVEDYYAQVKRLITEKGVRPEKIYCHGHSLGGAVTILAVDRLHKEGFPVKIYADRTFSHLINVSTGVYFEKKRPRKIIARIGATLLLAPLLGYLFAFTSLSLLTLGLISSVAIASLIVDPLFKIWDKTVANFLDGSMRALMRFSDWVMDVAPVFDKIPDEYKSYTVTIGSKRKKSSLGLGEKHVQGHTHDKVIHHRHSLHKGLTQGRAKRKAIRKELKQALEQPVCCDETAIRIENLKKQLRSHSNAKLSGGTHMCWPKEFKTRYHHHVANNPITGQQRLYHFIEDEGKHVEPAREKYKVF